MEYIRLPIIIKKITAICKAILVILKLKKFI
jgi:hypothetical protein